MDYGVSNFVTDYSAPPAEVAREVEARGFESLFVPEHTHIPVDRVSPYPAGGDLPEQYWHSLDPFVALAAAATATTRLKVGTGVCLVVERDPITLAKEVATLDFISGGRFLFGIGAGWNREEMANHGTNPTTRWQLMAERVAAMRAIWSADAPEFHGRFVDFDPDLAVAQAGAAARAAGAARRGRRAGPRRRGGLRRRVDPHLPSARGLPRIAGLDPSAGRGGRDGPRSRSRCSTPRPTRPSWPFCATSACPAASSPCPRPPSTTSFP